MTVEEYASHYSRQECCRKDCMRTYTIEDLENVIVQSLKEVAAMNGREKKDYIRTKIT